MRTIAFMTVTPALLAIATTAAGQTAPASPKRFDMPSYQEPAQAWRDIRDPTERARCEERIRQVRAEAGKPESERKKADAQDPLMIAAVGQEIDGCSVLVMKHDTSDMRPLPDPPEGPVRIEPAD